jgi:DNA-binding MarR family transcriptional regulator
MTKENLYFQIELTARKIKHYGQTVLNNKGIDITIEQWLVLKVISENEGLNQIQIGEILFKDKPTISRMIKSLTKKGFVFKDNSSEDLRAFIIGLTEDGKKLVAHLIPIIEKVREKGLKNLSENQNTTTSKTLSKIRNNLNH